MAIYHCSVKVGSRSKGVSAVGACAYREGKKIEEDRLGVTHDYSRKSGVVDSFTLAPQHAPDWAKNSAELWNQVERSEKRKDAQVYREVVVALPRELDLPQQKQLVTAYTQKNFVAAGMCATVAIHDTGKANPHAHILLTTRTIEKDGFGQKQRDWNQKSRLEGWRSDWSAFANRALHREGHSVRIDHRSLAAQGVSRLPQVHMGKAATAMERKGMETERGDRNRAVVDSNHDMSNMIEQGIAAARARYAAHKTQEAARQAQERVAQQRREQETKAQEQAKREREAQARRSQQRQRGRGLSR